MVCSVAILDGNTSMAMLDAMLDSVLDSLLDGMLDAVVASWPYVAMASYCHGVQF